MTRFYDPSSNQLNRLYAITEKSNLERMWSETHPDTAYSCTYINPAMVNDARYQLYGEYLHAYEDTFAHRDMNNLAYDKFSFNDNNIPGANIGHVGVGDMIDIKWDDLFGTHSDDGSWEAPDQTFNSEEFDIESKCSKTVSGPRGDRYVRNNSLDEAGCKAWGGTYHAGGSWQYNELRTLRMEYMVFEKLQKDFSEEIADNKKKGGKAATWDDLAGAPGWDASTVRVGGNPVLNREFESDPDANKLQDVLQQFNASENSEKYDVLDDWLLKNGYQGMPKLKITKYEGTAKEEAELKGTDLLDRARQNREDFLQWLPRETAVSSGVSSNNGTPIQGVGATETEFGVILPPSPLASIDGSLTMPEAMP